MVRIKKENYIKLQEKRKTFSKFIRDFNEYQSNNQSTLDIFGVK